MKAGIYLSPKQVKMTEREMPVPRPDEALIKVSYAGICGTDMMIYHGLHPRAEAPLILGHEFSGIVAASDGDRVNKGDRVVVEPLLNCGFCAPCREGQAHVCKSLRYIGIDQNGGFAEYTTVPLHRLRVLPESVTEKMGAMIEPLAVAIHTVRRSKLKVGDTAAILGAGPIGLLIGLIAERAGAGKIVISDVSPVRLQAASKMGFEAVDARKTDISQVVKEYTDGCGADVVYEVAGNQTTADQMIECVKHQGEIAVVSVYKKPPVIQLAAMHFREISLMTTRCYSPGDFTKAIELLEQNKLNLDPLVSHTLPLEDIQTGFNLMENPDQALKILFKL
ncbi:alcohol dehydrogenase catalytic domain-containing protein [Bacillus haynesii]|uniref:zinc-dependent alcohol dehydrogenase n=1 Tax=Bacillus haynesii TaxID=1925021 RepID=UPI0012BA321E|nr:alcohol dehydrogenase catalytic domain-containing protein [Bacillus haynesii]TWK25197.1 L-threonine 3-dehydrogenase [Bacillus licheniformis]MCY7838594.1 alcohol dehydrogenase catalytic domain-containing protein [Bacillus haynesii]MCY7843760.1 alcohol dehydrogenase catalytic domain-containing protein [Bacillus haynesii]MCY7850471.1 alcohol dehydrogenase catalytic domain-containing protein [Bacillus haynesii]MCY7969078.1 alcohol dehydrogenase catalytic domain-containing protein [Bacillus hayn